MILIISSKNSYATKELQNECRLQKVGCMVMDVQDLVDVRFKINPADFDVLYIRNPYLNGSPEYLPQIVKLAKRFLAAGKKVVDNIITSGRLGEGKWADYLILKKNRLPIPKTYLLTKKTMPKKFPFILKWVFGFKGKNVFLIHNQQEFNRVFKKYAQEELMVQEFVEAEYEYKVITVGYKSLPIILRFDIHPKTHRPDFKTARSVPIYGRTITPMNRHATRVAKLAEKAAKVLGRELSKIDILEKVGKFYILEVNRFPGLDSFEKLTKFNVVKEFVKYLKK